MFLESVRIRLTQLFFFIIFLINMYIIINDLSTRGYYFRYFYTLFRTIFETFINNLFEYLCFYLYCIFLLYIFLTYIKVQIFRTIYSIEKYIVLLF